MTAGPTPAELRDRIATDSTRALAGFAAASAAEAQAEGKEWLPPVTAGGSEARLTDADWIAGGTSISASSTPLPSARRSARPRKHPPDRGLVGIQVFALWEKAASPNTPVSLWKGSQKEYVEPRHPLVDIVPTMRSTIVGPAQLPTLPIAGADDPRTYSGPLSAFEGLWVSMADGELRGRIIGNSLIWEEDGSETRLKFFRGNSRKGVGDILQMKLDGATHFGHLSDDAHVLRWKDGDRWIRLDQSFERMQSYCDHEKLPQDFQLQGWKSVNRCLLSKNSKALSRPTTSSSRGRPGSRPSTRDLSARCSLSKERSLSPPRSPRSRVRPSSTFA